MLIMRRIWIVIEIPPFIAFAYPHIDDQLYELYEDLEIMNICLFFFFFWRKEIIIFIVFMCSSYFSFSLVREDFSLSIDRNIFQGERDGGENLLG